MMAAWQAKYLQNWIEEPIGRQGWNNTHEHTIVRMGHRNWNSWPAMD
jgi:hypothetical protein